MANGVSGSGSGSGSVKFFNSERGYGFIQADDGSADIFIHIRELRRAGHTTLSEGQKVSYETEPGRNGKGPKAVNIRVER